MLQYAILFARRRLPSLIKNHRLPIHVRSAVARETVKKEILKFPRQALHAEKLEFIHPKSQKKVNYSAKPPKDLLQLIELLKNLNE